MRASRNIRFILKSAFVLFAIFLYCEYIVYFVVLRCCDWPSLDPQNEDSNIPKSNEQPLHVMVLADTHLLGSRKGHWFDKLRREWQMYRTFQTALTLHKPDIVFVLGDLTDEGLYCGKDEFEYYVRRFHNLFAVPRETKMYVVVGNHDIGFHYSISPYLNQRFVQAFKSPAVQLVTIRGNHFVLINSMALEGDGCFLCRPAEIQLSHIERQLKCTKGEISCDSKLKLKKYSRPILMQHYPLYRESDKDCNEPDEAPFPLKNQKFREKWECISKDATYQILRQIEPRLAMSGHTHHGCTRSLPHEGVEITLPSFSWRNKNNPSYGLVVITPNNYSFYKCLMPNESTIIRTYIIGILCYFCWIIYSIYKSSRRRKFKYH